ncbi:sugar isomerase [Oscillospiraceae bacterium MB08-C2-2]|nr:sugar isomerase [Oscillospiraceae bacterium MB08-C2-2]
MSLHEQVRIITDELTRAMAEIDELQCEALVEQILGARRVLVTGVGRVLISLKAWVKRLLQLGIDINFVGSETEGPIFAGDLLLVASSSGESAIPKAIAAIAKEKGTHVAYIGCTRGSTIEKLAHSRLLLVGRTKFARPGEFASVQPMSTLFEQQLYLLGDVLALMIMERKGLSEADVKNTHANLE